MTKRELNHFAKLGRQFVREHPQYKKIGEEFLAKVKKENAAADDPKPPYYYRKQAGLYGTCKNDK